MNLKVFNACLLLGWLMVVGGGVIIHPGWGIALGGLLLLLLTLLSAYLGGLQAPKRGEQDGAARAADGSA